MHNWNQQLVIIERAHTSVAPKLLCHHNSFRSPVISCCHSGGRKPTMCFPSLQGQVWTNCTKLAAFCLESPFSWYSIPELKRKMSVTVTEKFHYPCMKVSYFIHLFIQCLCPGIAFKVANANTEILHTVIPTLSSILPFLHHWAATLLWKNRGACIYVGSMWFMWVE